MNTHFELSENKGAVLALGFFDGLHIAHQKLIKKTVELSKENETKSALITFKKAPSSIVLKKEPLYITLLDEKIKLIKELGIDDIYILDFNDFMGMKADCYLKDVLIKYFCPKYIVTGFNHTFGHNREGNNKLLAQFDSIYKYIEIEPVSVENTLISSTNIKKAIKDGEIEIANKMLGRNFSIEGKVIKGAQIARKLGYKTANIIWDKERIKPKYGVYRGFCEYLGITYQALINFGVRPSIDKELKETLEVHLIGFEGNLYDKNIKVEFSSKMRDEIKFNSQDELKKQIDLDFKALTKLPEKV